MLLLMKSMFFYELIITRTLRAIMGSKKTINFFYLAMEDYKYTFSNLMPKSIANNVVIESIFGDKMKLWRGKDERPSPILLGLLRSVNRTFLCFILNSYIYFKFVNSQGHCLRACFSS